MASPYPCPPRLRRLRQLAAHTATPSSPTPPLSAVVTSGFTGTGASHGRAHRPTVTGANGVVACAHPLAAQAGLA